MPDNFAGIILRPIMPRRAVRALFDHISTGSNGNDCEASFFHIIRDFSEVFFVSHPGSAQSETTAKSRQ